MTMDETTQERIAKESVQSDVQNQNKSWEYRAGYRNGYIAGATADAAQTETLANVLDQIAQAPTPDNEREMISWIQTARHLCQTALEQWKGKEPERPCPHCGKELSRDRNLCCRECGKGGRR